MRFEPSYRLPASRRSCHRVFLPGTPSDSGTGDDLGLGLLAALGATRSLQALLFEVSATEPLVFAAAALILGGVAVIASWIPARAATKADPLHAIRD
jgi:ABC-type lipoprotein release transport system permease subunit